MKTHQRVIIIIICFLILAASAWYVYPLPSDDSIYFLPTAWFYANDLGFINPLVSLTYETDPLHIGRYCFHLPLFPLVIGILSKINPSVHGLFIVCGVISMSNVLLFEKLIFKKIKRNEHFIYISSLLLYTFCWLPTKGRPEILSSFLILIVYFSYQNFIHKNKIIIYLIIGFLLGVLLCCSITAYCFTTLILTINIISVNNLNKNTLFYISTYSIISIIIGLSLILISPNGLDNINGILTTGNYINSRFELNWGNVIRYFFLSGDFFMLAPFVAFVIFFFLKELYHNHLQVEFSLISRITIIILLSIACFLFYSFVIKIPPRHYDVVQFSGIFLIYIVVKIKDANTLIKSTYIGLLFLGLIHPLRSTLLFFDYINDMKTYQQASNVIKVFVKKNNTPIIVGTSAIWVLCEDLRNFRYYQEKIINFKIDSISHENYKHEQRVLLNKSAPLFIEQARAPLSPIIEKSGKLIFDWRTKNRREVFSLPMTNRPQGYSFSVWNIKKVE